MKRRGFTLIELIIVISIMVIIMGISLASYNNFTEVKKLDSDADKLTDVLEMARKKSIAAEVVGTCINFQGYAVDISAGSYKLQQCCPACSDLTGFSSYSLESTNMVNTGSVNIKFGSLVGNIKNNVGIGITTDIVLTIKNKIINKSININISPLGIIGEE